MDKTEVLKDLHNLDNVSLFQGLWGTMRELFVSTFAGAKWGSTYVKTESVLAKHSYLESRMSEILAEQDEQKQVK